MKKIRLFAIIFILLLTVSSCGGPKPGPSTPDIVVSSTLSTINLKDTDVLNFDFKSLFIIKEDDKLVNVLDEYIDKSKLTSDKGEYKVTCNYKEKSASVTVIVYATEYKVELSTDEVTVKLDSVENYDFLSLFTATVDGVKIAITTDMVTNNVKKEVGTYEVTVTIHNVSKTLIVHVTDNHNYLVVPNYKEFEIEYSKFSNLDLTTLFTFYVDGVIKRVTKEMVSISTDQVEVGNSYVVSFKHTINGELLSSSVILKIVPDEEITINAKNVQTYPNGGYVDLITLFTIYKGNEEIPVTIDMIEGNVDYTKEGIYKITITYQGVTKEATVEVKKGVIIDYTTSDKILITKGTDITTYDFLKDFKVIINGLHFPSISEDYLELGDINFNEVGEYIVKLTIPYNDSKLGLSQVKFTYVEKTITYKVIENNYEIKIIKDVLHLPIDTLKYNEFNNLDVYINGRNQTLTKVKENVDLITCYAEVLSSPIDPTKLGQQEVKIAVYVNGVKNEPVVVTYTVIMESDIKVSSTNKVIFEGTTIFTKDLFSIVENNKEVEVTFDMISGAVDVFTSGTYVVTINYKGIIETAKVIVLKPDIVGIYYTALKTIPEETEDEEYGTEITESVRLANVKINSDLTIGINKKEATLVDAIDENTLVVKIATTEYTLYFIDGILMINPNNDVKLSFSNDKRPLMYFNQDVYMINSHLEVNSGSSYVLANTVTTYSIDAFKITSHLDGTSKWYGMKVHLVDKTSVDTIYTVTWGEIEVCDDFEMVTKKVNKLTLNGVEYQFTMISDTVGKVSKDTNEKKYAGLTFEGVIDAKPAKLIVSLYEGFTLTIDGKTIFSLSTNEVSALKNGGIDYQNDEVFLYSAVDGFSYKFVLDVDNYSFTVLPKDEYVGKYQNGNVLIFIDGYGTGVINFNTNSYYLNEFKYTVNAKSIEIEYLNTKPTFEYESKSRFYIDEFGNVLTSKSFMNDTMNEVAFENQFITDGGIVRINYFKVGADADAVAKVNMFNNIEIITKDGELSYEEKIKCIDTSKIKFGRAGFYQFTITLPVNGKNVTCYYAIEIQAAKYENNILIGEYGTGVLFEANSLSIDKYGNAIIQASNIIFRGTAKINDASFVIKATSDSGAIINAVGYQLSEGVVLLRCSGAVSFSDYFTKGTHNVTGTNKLVLRQFKYNSNIIYILSSTSTSVGEVVELEDIENDIIKIKSQTNEYIVKIVSWGNAKEGLILSDDYRGTYTLEGASNLVVDGFNGVKCGDLVGTYTMNSNALIMTIGQNVKVYRLLRDTMTYELVDIALDSSLVEGKTFSSTYAFVCSGYFYNAITSFAFKTNGKVLITSTSEEHDSGEDSCSEDIYDPSFASKKGVYGTYTVNGNTITITVNDITIVLTINNVLYVNRITVKSTTVEKGSHGYFGAGTEFDI